MTLAPDKPGRPEEPKDEYKALRDEMLQLFNRTFVVLAAELTAFTTLSWRSIESVDAHVMFRLAFLGQVLLVAGLWLSLMLYQQIYNIGSYLIVFHESNGSGWHSRRRTFRIVLRDMGAPWYENLSETRTTAVAYALIGVANLVLGVRGFEFAASNWSLGATVEAFVLLTVSAFASVLVVLLARSYRLGARRWVERWQKYHAECGTLTSHQLMSRLLLPPKVTPDRTVTNAPDAA